jgi:hypothetical protein
MMLRISSCLLKISGILSNRKNYFKLLKLIKFQKIKKLRAKITYFQAEIAIQEIFLIKA